MNYKDDRPQTYIAQREHRASKAHEPSTFYAALRCQVSNGKQFQFEVKILSDFGKEFEYSYVNLGRNFHPLKIIAIDRFNNIPLELLVPLATKAWNVADLIDENPWFAIGLLDQSKEIERQLLIVNIQMCGLMYPVGGFVPKPFFQPHIYARIQDTLFKVKISSTKSPHSPNDFIDIQLTGKTISINFPAALTDLFSKRSVYTISDFRYHFQSSKHTILGQLRYSGDDSIQLIEKNILDKKLGFLKAIAENTEEYSQYFKVGR